MKLRISLLLAAFAFTGSALLAPVYASGSGQEPIVLAKNGADNAPGDNHGGNSGSGGSGRGGRDDGPGHTSIKGSTDLAKGGNSGSGRGGNGGGSGRGGHDDGPGHT